MGTGDISTQTDAYRHVLTHMEKKGTWQELENPNMNCYTILQKDES